ncbi:MAG: biopolymer transporter ExbD [Planctomycetaceae bacterium]|nr:biopolymer transporter ExbD [Planctomycetaceae bacterium]
MKIRNRTGETKIEAQMAPMIDVVFQLLIFFMLTLKIIEPEGDFDINMPIGKPASSSSSADLQPFKVRMEADPDTGELQQLYFNGNPLGKGEGAFQLLNAEVFRSIRALEAAGSSKIAEDQEVEIDPAYGLHYENVIAAISACSGRMDNGKMVRFISKIKFAPIRDKP